MRRRFEELESLDRRISDATIFVSCLTKVRTIGKGITTAWSQFGNLLIYNRFIKGNMMIRSSLKLSLLCLVVFAVAMVTAPSTAEAQCSGGYGYSRSYAPSYRSYNYGYGGGYYNPRAQRIRRIATVAIVAGVIVAAANSDGRSRRRRF